MQYWCNAVVVLVIFVVFGTSNEVLAMGPRGPMQPMQPSAANAPRQAHNIKIVLRKVEVEPGEIYGDYIGEQSSYKVEMYNDSMPVFNAILILLKTLPPNFQVEVSGYNLQASNQWVPVFHQGVQNYCEYAETNVSFMKRIMEASNFTECPIKKGVYAITNMLVDEKGFPPNTPDGMFKIFGIFSVGQKHVLRMSFYADVQQKDEDDE